MSNICRAKDNNKDQTYFIWQIKKEQLSHILFPVGEFENKTKVREYATTKDLITSQKPDSQGLCFVGQTSLREMLLQTLGQKNGDIVAFMTREQLIEIGLGKQKLNTEIQNREQKVVLGTHEGAFLYTIGQRQNLGLSNGPWFVSNVDIEKNEVQVCHQKYSTKLETKIN